MKRLITKFRISLALAILFVAFAILMLRGVFLVILSDDNILHQYSESQDDVKRIDILDRNNQIVATNLVTYILYAKPSIIRDAKLVVSDIKKFFPEVNQKLLLKKISDVHHKGRVLLVRDLTPTQKEKINRLGHVGLYFHEDYKRFYPYRNLLSHLLGFVGRDKRGLAGLEKYLDRHISSLDVKGHDKVDKFINLTIDVNVQTVLHKELSKAVRKFSADGATAIVMDINNFEIYGLVSLPDYNPYYPEESILHQKYNNKASYNLYEMGSSFKTFTFALALEEGMLNIDEEFDVAEDVKIDRFTIKDFKKIDEKIDAVTVFAKSSNIGTVQIAQRFSKELQRSFYQKLNLFAPLNIELVEKSNSQIPKRWGKSKIITASYGYGVSVTAVHLMQAMAAMLNGGYLRDATLLKGANQDKLPTQVVSYETSQIIRKLFQAAVQNGTGWRARSKGYDIGGKTGSANKIGKYGYDEGRLLSSFIGAFPIMKPEYLVLVLVDEPKGIKETGGYATGGAVAAPVVKNIIEKIAPLLNINPDIPS